MEYVECGAAALAIILAYHGQTIPLEELRVACDVSRDGSKASNIMKASRVYGLEPKGFHQKPPKLREAPYPVIIHWNFNHFVVLEGIDGDKVYLNDPATGPRTITFEELDQSFTGIVITFEKAANFEKGGVKRGLMSALQKRLKGSEIILTYILLVSLALIIPGLVIPTFARIFVDFYLIQQFKHWIWPLLLGMGLTAAIRVSLTWLQQYYLLRLETKLSLSNSSRVYWHVLRLPIEFFTQRSAGEIGSRVRLNDRIAELLSSQLATTVLNAILIIFFAILMFQYSILLTVIGILMASINLLVLRYISRRRADVNQRLLQESGKMLGMAYSGLQAIETIKATGAENDFFTRWSGYQSKVFSASQELGVSTQVLAVIPPFLSSLTTIAILTFGSLGVMNGTLTVGMLVAFQTLMSSFLTPVNQMVNVGGQLQEVEGILNRLDDVFRYRVDPQVKITEIPDEDAFAKAKLSGQIELRNVSFGYSKLSPPLIENFNLSLTPGSRVALVGSSGSGKSTIARLVAGLYEPRGGEILFDGRPRSDISRAVINNSLAVVNQEIFLFDGTIRENLTMWDKGIPEEDVIQAAKDAHIHDEISDRSEAYEAMVEERGRNFSGGQRQRLEIARALVVNPTILVLDEATSALDPVVEKIIDGNLRRRGCTCLIVAHRLSTIRDCDEIIVLENGKVVQRGTHDDLWQNPKGAYARLIRVEAPQAERTMELLMEALYE
jgi:NHLM bacteriocin system ABC transporter peptidase/ATP-binding protein